MIVLGFLFAIKFWTSITIDVDILIGVVFIMIFVVVVRICF